MSDAKSSHWGHVSSNRNPQRLQKTIGLSLILKKLGPATAPLRWGALPADHGATKRWQRPLTIGNGLKSVSSGRAKPLTRACASNMPAWVRFGLSTLRGLSAPAQSRRQNQKSPSQFIHTRYSMPALSGRWTKCAIYQGRAAMADIGWVPSRKGRSHDLLGRKNPASQKFHQGSRLYSAPI